MQENNKIEKDFENINIKCNECGQRYNITVEEYNRRSEMQKYHVVQYANYFKIQDEPFYGGKDILDAEDVGEEQAAKNANHIANLLNAAAPSSTPQSVEGSKWQLCPKCSGNGLIHNPHSMSTSVTDLCDVCNGAKILATPDYSELLEVKNNILAQRNEYMNAFDNLKQVLIECDDYFDNYADADYIQEQYSPNPEMVLLSRIRQALKNQTP